MLPIVRALDRHHRCLLLSLGFLFLTVVGFTGCGKTDSQPSAAKLQTQNSRPLLKFHWLGKQRLAAEANATNFMAIWSLPESAKLEAQTLDKLATAPWRLWQTNVAVSNAPTALLRPLLDDLVQHEVYVEASGATNHPAELVLAIRLPADRTALWETNLPQILTSLFATNLTPAGPSSIFHLPSADLTMSRSNDWTLLSFTRSGPPPSNLRPQISSLLAAFHACLATTPNPYPARATNYWLECNVAAGNLAASFDLGCRLPVGFPQANLTLVGDGESVRTRGELIFDHALLTNLPPWQLPLQLTLEPLIGLTATRSFKPILLELGIFSPAQAEKFPDQLLAWMRSGPPLQMYFAYPFAGNSNAFVSFAQPVMEWINGHADARRFGAVAFDSTNLIFRWDGLQLGAPFLRLVANPTNSYVFGGFGITSMYKPKLPDALHQHVLSATNLIYFDWEHTHDTLPQWRYLDDGSRLIFDTAHVSRLRGNSAIIGWIKANLYQTNLSHCLTEIRLVAPDRLALTRKSTLGLSALELDILANWVELPDFPAGMSSLWRTNPTPFLRLRTNSAVAPPVSN